MGVTLSQDAGSLAAATAPDEQPRTTQRSSRRHGWAASYREIWEHREVLYFLTLRNLKIRYRQTVLGVAWTVLQPLAFTALFVLVADKLMTVDSDGVPYPLFAFAALVPWGLFSQSITFAAPSVVQDINLVSKVYVPRLLMPLAAIAILLVDFVITLALLFGFMAFYSITPQLDALFWVPSMTLLALAASLGAGIWLSALMVMYRDVRVVVPFLVQVLLLLTPIAYSSNLVPEEWQFVYGLNPMASVVEGFRSSLLGTSPPAGRMVAASAASAVVLLGVALAYFRRVDRTFADVI